jgi:hypothetical protein
VSATRKRTRRVARKGARRKGARRKGARRKGARRKSRRRSPKGKYVKMHIGTPPRSRREKTHYEELPRKRFQDRLYLRPDTFNRITLDGEEIDEKTSGELFRQIDGILQATVVGFMNKRRREFGTPKRITIKNVIGTINRGLPRKMSDYFVEIIYPQERRGRGLEFVPKTITLQDYVVIRLKGMGYHDDT